MTQERNRVSLNAEVIEELTKDLENSCIKVDEDSMVNVSSDMNMETTNVADKWDIVDAQRTNNESNNAQNTDLLEDVDEELLKDREINLTEAEKEV